MNLRLPSRNRVVWLLIGLLLLGNFCVLVYIALRQPDLIIQQFRGVDGKSGESIKGEVGDSGHTPIKGMDYFDGRDGRDGRDGQTVVGPQGPPGPAGQDGINGTNGEDGQDGRNVEFSCQNGDFTSRYEGDDGWKIIQEDSVTCKETLW